MSANTSSPTPYHNWIALAFSAEYALSCAALRLSPMEAEHAYELTGQYHIGVRHLEIYEQIVELVSLGDTPLRKYFWDWADHICYPSENAAPRMSLNDAVFYTVQQSQQHLKGNQDYSEINCGFIGGVMFRIPGEGWMLS